MGAAKLYKSGNGKRWDYDDGEQYAGGGYVVGDSAGGSAPGEQVVFLNCLDLGRQKAVGHNGKLNQIMEKERVICLKSLMKKI